MGAVGIAVNYGLNRLVPVGLGRVAVNQESPCQDEIRVNRIKRDVAIASQQQTEDALEKERAKQKKLWASFDRSLNEFIDDVEEKVSEQLIDLSVRIAEIIIRRELPDVVMLKDIVRDSLSPLSDAQGALIHLSPADASAMLAIRQQEDQTALVDRVDIVADKALSDGDVMIESRNGYFNGQISERLNILKESLSERYRNTHNAK